MLVSQVTPSNKPTIPVEPITQEQLQLLTVHRCFAKKESPKGWLFRKFGNFVQMVNSQLL